MKKSKITVAVAVLLTSMLSGCKDNDGNTVESIEPQSKVVKVIDGYIDGAEVFVDRNSDGMPSVDESIGMTHSGGQIEVLPVDQKYPLIAKMRPMISKDNDTLVDILSEFIFKAPAGSDVITPFSTIINEHITAADLASLFDVRESLLSSDYVGDVGLDRGDAIVVHAIARSLTTLISSRGHEDAPIDLDTLRHVVHVLMPAIHSYVNEHGLEQLDKVFFGLEGGKPELRKLYGSLGDYLATDVPWLVHSMLSGDVKKVVLDPVRKVMATHTINDEFVGEGDYLIDARRLISTGGVVESFDLISSDFAVVASSGGGLSLWTKNQTLVPMLVAPTDFGGKAWGILGSEGSKFEHFEFHASHSVSGVALPGGKVEKHVEGSEMPVKGEYFVAVENVLGFGPVSVLNITMESGESRRLVQSQMAGLVKVMFDLDVKQYTLMAGNASLVSHLMK